MNILALVLLGAVMVGEGSGPEQQGTPTQSAPRSRTEQVPLLDTYWKLVALADLKPTDQPGSREPHVVFHTAGGAVTGSDGCNSIRATYTLDGESLKIGVLMGTLMACPVPDRLDRRFREALVIARSWRISDGKLTLLDADGTVLARFDPRLDR